MVGHLVLVQGIGVRVPTPQHWSARYRGDRRASKTLKSPKPLNALFRQGTPAECSIQNKKSPIKVIFCLNFSPRKHGCNKCRFYIQLYNYNMTTNI